MYRPADLADGSDNGDDEFIELLNTGTFDAGDSNSIRRFTPWNVRMPASNSSAVSNFFSSSIALTPTMLSML